MTIADCYDALARMIEYPDNKQGLQSDCDTVSSFMNEQCKDRHSILPFADFMSASSLAQLQEEYVATFDFNPATAPYLGHHLFGDNQKKAVYMVMLKQEFERRGYTPTGVELPDHLSVLLAFLGHRARRDGKEDGEMDQDGLSSRRKFIADCVLPGVERMNAAFATKHDSNWKALVETAWLLCAADCKEVPSC